LPLHKTPIINNIIEGLTNAPTTATPAAKIRDVDTKIMNCQPISEIDNGDIKDGSSQMEPSYLIPVQGQYSNLSTTNQFLQITIYYCTFIVITLGILIILPSAYNTLAIQAIKTYFENKEDMSEDNVKKNTITGLNTLEICVRIFFVLFILGCFIFGFLYEASDVNPESTLTIGIKAIDNLNINVIVFGLYFFIILITCSLVLFNAKEGLLKQNDLFEASSVENEGFTSIINNIINQFMGMTSKEYWIFGYTFAILAFAAIIYLIVDYKAFMSWFDGKLLLLVISGIFGAFIMLYYLIFVLVGKA
jgi:hypothetical protein